jgi:hypothetical protein
MAIFNEKKYEWNEEIDSITVCNILIKAPECIAKEDFKVWCFDRRYTYDKVIFFSSSQGADLLSELHKPSRKAWLNFAIMQGYVKEFKAKPTFRIGDVIEFIEKTPDVENRYIINICKEDTICLNSKKGTRWGNMFSVEDAGNIKYEEIHNKVCKNFKKVGNGVEDLL